MKSIKSVESIESIKTNQVNKNWLYVHNFFGHYSVVHISMKRGENYLFFFFLIDHLENKKN